MPKMIALKRFHYPSGVHGKDYAIGDEVEVLSDRDAKVLRMGRVAKDAPAEGDTAAVSTTGAKTADAEGTTTTRRRTYARRDMTAEQATPVAPMTTQTGPNPPEEQK